MAPLPKIEASYVPQTLWSKSVGDGIEGYFSQLKPAFIDDKMFVASRDGKVRALSVESGKELWEVDLADNEVNALNKAARISGAVAAGHDAIYLGTENAQVFALDAETGEVRWIADPKGEVIARPLVDDGKVIVHTSRGDLYAFDESTGEELWVLHQDLPTLTLRGSSEPVSASGAVVYGRGDGKVAAVFIQNGRPIWEKRVAVPKGATELDRIVDVDAKPIIIGQTGYIIAYNGDLLAIDLPRGEVLWKRSYSGFANMAVAGFNLYLTDHKGHIYALDRRNGTEVWSNTQLEYRNVTAPVIAGPYLAVGDAEGYLHWLNREDGAFVAQQELDSDGLYIPPVNNDGKLYLQTRGGKIIALERP